MTAHTSRLHALLRRGLCSIALSLLAATSHAVDLADAPLFSTVVVPGNLALALSVEWPTATTPAYTTSYATTGTFLGYFDPGKCYTYVYDATTPANSYFKPYSKTTTRTCTSSATLQLWSGNYLNWMSMQTLDTFRWVLTGGYRSTDSTTSTVLTKTYAGYDSTSVIPNKALSSSTLITGATPLTWTALNTRVRNIGTAIYFTNTGTGVATWTGTGTAYTDYNGHNGYVASNKTAYANPATIYRLFINVKVCDSTIGVEDNCVLYGTNYKPEGLLQKYASKLRYSVFSYYNHSSTARDGGVMRARMKYIGPTQPVPGSSAITNSATEWSSTTGIMLSNPDSSDATTTIATAATAGYAITLTNSGVMNYLNKFGYSAQSYKSYDPVGELYYAVNRYFRNLGNVTAYSSMASAGSAATLATWLDGFPAISTWDDPIAYSCQKNFILGIGDVYAHRDANLPGTSLTSTSEPTIPTAVSGDTTVSVTTATNMVGTLEGYSSLASTWLANSNSRGNTYYIAGLAYDAHTKDIRTDLNGKQTINTYWMDVHEGQNYMHKNQYWLAAKYGGFTVPDGFLPYSANNGTSTLADSLWTTSSDTLPFSGTTYQSSISFSTDGSGSTDKRPDNYFPGNSPATMKSGLTGAFEKIVSEATTATSTVIASTDDRETSSGNANYRVSYDPNTWSSTLKGQLVSYDSDGAATYEDVWNATTLLDARTSSDRLIITCCTSDGLALPFTYANLSGGSLHTRTNFSSFDEIVGVSTTSQSQENYTNYLRGTRSNELANSGVYRTRSHLLGDIINGKLTAVGAPNSTYYEVYNPGYGQFKSDYADRPTVVYAPSNDGMLHAFDGTVPSSASAGCTSTLTTPSALCGKEVFAYLPSFTYEGSTVAASSGLAALGNPSSFTHHYLVDGTPVSADVDFYLTNTPTATTNDWRTIVVGSLGKGGKGYYAFDATAPKTWTSETILAGKVLWEFAHTHLGYTYGDATIVKTPQYGWTVILPSGYNNDDGIGYIFLINPRTGALLKTISMPEGTAAAPLNLAHVEAFIPDASDGTADALYAGDLQGNVWRVDLTSSKVITGNTTTSSYEYSTVKLAKATDPSGNAQPISTRLLIQPDPSSGKRYVLFGTGQLLSDSDISSAQVQSFYAIIDGLASYGKFYNSSSGLSTTASSITSTHSGVLLPSGIDFPVTRSVLVANTDLTVGITASSTQPMGWYFDLPVDATSGIAQRVNVRPDVTNGMVAFAGNLPNGDACSPAGTATAYAVSFADGLTSLTDSAGNAIASIALTSAVTDIVFKSVNGTTRLYAGSGDGTVVKLPGTFQTSSSYKRLNWREVPTTN